jgi:hypothetical protein
MGATGDAINIQEIVPAHWLLGVELSFATHVLQLWNSSKSCYITSYEILMQEKLQTKLRK